MGENNKYYVGFESLIAPFIVGDKPTNRYRRKTFCHVWQDNLIIVAGASANVFRDQDCKFEGQKAALTNALGSNKQIIKATRAKIWNQFFSQSKKGRLIVGKSEEATA